MRFTRPLRPARKIRRHSLASAGVAVGAVLGIVAMTGLTTASASANVGSAAADDVATTIFTAPLSATATAETESLEAVTAEATATLGAAQSARAAAEAVTADIAASGLDVGIADTTVDTTALGEQIDRLNELDVLPLFFVPGISDATAAETERVNSQTADLREALVAAQAAKAAADAAAQAQREAEAAAAALAAANTPDGAKAAARQIAAAEHGWGSDQFSCLASLWNRESGWNYQAYNAGSGATGIPQSLPGSKMASAGADWQTNATTQIRWGLDYIARAYGSPCGAWSHSQGSGWY